MKILLEVLERDRFEIYDPPISAAAEPAKIIHEAQCHDVMRILKFDPATMQMWDVTAEYYEEYRGSYGDEAPLWIRLQPDFEELSREEDRDAREWQHHIKSLSHAA